MKRFLALILTAVMALSVTACSSTEDWGLTIAEEKSTAAQSEKPSEKEEKKVAITPIMWKITDKNGAVAYLFGSAHYTDTLIYSMPEYFDKAYAECDCVALEYTGEDSVPDIAYYSDSSEISGHVSKEAYDFAKKTIEENGYYDSSLEKSKPAAWTALLSKIRSASAGYVYSIETMFTDLAQKDSKELVSLESKKTHTEYNYTQPEKIQEWVFENTANEAAMSNTEASITQYEKWKKGLIKYEDEVKKLDTLSDEELSQLSDADREYYNLYNEYIDWIESANLKRNKEMAQSIIKLMSEGKTPLAAPGVLHCLGENSVAALLEKQGCTVEEIN